MNRTIMHTVVRIDRNMKNKRHGIAHGVVITMKNVGDDGGGWWRGFGGGRA